MPTFRPSSQADEAVLSLTPRVTGLSSAQIRAAWSAKVKDVALFSARTTVESYLRTLRGILGEVAGGKVTPQVAETRLRKTLRDLGYSPHEGFAGAGEKVPPATPGAMTDLSSSRRIDLILDTNVKQARSLAQIASSSDPMAAYMRPAWKLTRTGKRKKPRGDWRRRWAAAGAACGWRGAAKGVFVALKDSPIWAALGKGAGGFGDVVGTAYPPFAFGSGMAWVNVGRREWNEICRREGIVSGDGERLAAAKAAFGREVSGGPPGAQGTAERRTETVAGTHPYPVAIPPWKPDEGLRAATLAKVAECSETVGRMADRAKAAVARIRADVGLCRERSCGDGRDTRLVESAERRLRAAEEAVAAISEAVGRLERYARAVADAPAPALPGMLEAFNAAMGRYADAAVKTMEMAHSQSTRVGMAASAARKTAEMMVFTADLGKRTAAEGWCGVSMAAARKAAADAERCGAELRAALDAAKSRLAASWPEVPTGDLDALYVGMAEAVAAAKGRADAAVAEISRLMSALGGLAEPGNRAEQSAFDVECAKAAQGADAARMDAEAAERDVYAFRGRAGEFTETADTLVERWKVEECARVENAAQTMAADAEGRFLELQRRVNAAKAELRRVCGMDNGGAKTKEELNLATAYTLMSDARSYVRRCMRELLAARDVGDVALARERLREMETRRMPYFGKKETTLSTVLGAFEVWVAAGAGMDADGGEAYREGHQGTEGWNWRQ